MPLTGPDILLYEKKGHLVTITMNRPERMNALSTELFERLAEVWEKYRDDEDAWCAILTGAGNRAFSAGADLKDMAERGGIGAVAAQRRRFSVEASAPTGCPGLWKPVIAAINGYAVAGGWFLAQNCDIRVAAESAQLGIAEVKWNLPAGWAVSLPHLLPLGLALEMVLTGERITAQRAYEIGFVNKVVPDDRLMEEAERMANIILDNGPMSVRFHKEILYRGLNLTYEQGVALAAHINRPLMTSEDAKEGPRAFVEKRKPQWKNR